MDILKKKLSYFRFLYLKLRKPISDAIATVQNWKWLIQKELLATV